MYAFTPKEIFWSEKDWRDRCYPFTEVEKAIEPVLALEALQPWLSAVRKASFKSVTEVAHRLNVTRPQYHKLEKAEENGEISLQRLRECAEALDCELVYFLRPKDRKNFSRRILDKILPEALKIKAHAFTWVRAHTLTERLVELTYDPLFRQRHGWCRNSAAEGRSVALTLRNLRATAPNSVTRRPSGPPKF